MTPATSSVPTRADGRPVTTHREIERRLLAYAAQGRRFELRSTADGRAYLTDVPTRDDAALLRAASGLALLSQATSV